MTVADSPQGALDYGSLHFPSDRITVADIRRAHPLRFDHKDGHRFFGLQNDPEFNLNTILYVERLLAKEAFEEARGHPGNNLGNAGLDRDDCLNDLTRFYQTYRIAQGRHHTEQLVRDFEAQARAIAKKGRQ